MVFSIFLKDNPEAYKNLLKGFINHHGIDSEKVRNLYLKESNLEDRIYNIHCITGNDTGMNTIRHHVSQNFYKSSIEYPISYTDIETIGGSLNDSVQIAQDLMNIFN